MFSIGLIRLINKKKLVQNDIIFLKLFRNKFVEFVNSQNNGTFIHEIHDFLGLNCVKAQDLLGYLGYIQYKPPFQNIIIDNYPLILNSISKLGEGSLHFNEINGVCNVLIRHIGVLNANLEETNSDIKNPLIWFKEGLKYLLSFPILILEWIGLINTSKSNSLSNSVFIKIFVLLGFIISLLANLVTIFQGQEKFQEIVYRILIQPFSK